MATQLAQKFKVIPKNGSNGDACIFTSSFVAAAAPIADVIRFAKMPAGTEVITVDLVNDPLGASSTLSAGYENVDGTGVQAAVFLAAASSSAAGRRTSASHPISFDDPAVITATVGGAAITGKVTALITYRFIGTK